MEIVLLLISFCFVSFYACNIYIYIYRKTVLYLFVSLTMHHCGQFLQDLLFSYNIAVDRSDEVKRTLAKSASSVGLQLPEVYQT